jgi:hypothetical protein
MQGRKPLVSRMEDIHKLKEKMSFTGMVVIPSFLFCFVFLFLFLSYIYFSFLFSLSSAAMDAANG